MQQWLNSVPSHCGVTPTFVVSAHSHLAGMGSHIVQLLHVLAGLEEAGGHGDGGEHEDAHWGGGGGKRMHTGEEEGARGCTLGRR